MQAVPILPEGASSTPRCSKRHFLTSLQSGRHPLLSTCPAVSSLLLDSFPEIEVVSGGDLGPDQIPLLSTADAFVC